MTGLLNQALEDSEGSEESVSFYRKQQFRLARALETTREDEEDLYNRICKVGEALLEINSADI